MAEDNGQEVTVEAQEQEDTNNALGLGNLYANLPRPKNLLSILQSIITIIYRLLSIGTLLDPRKIDANRIYSTAETAKFLGTDRIGVIRLIRADRLHARKLNENYNIVGRSIILFLRSQDDDSPPRSKRKARQGA